MTKKLIDVLMENMPEDVKNKEIDSIVVITVKNRPDGKWDPGVYSAGAWQSPRDIAMACSFAARDIAVSAGLITEEQAAMLDKESTEH